MSLIGIWGPSAIGKTTWLRSIMPGLIKYDPIIVCGDLSQEWHYDHVLDSWAIVAHDAKRWKGNRTEKVPYIDSIIHDDEVWIVESMRWFNGIQKELVKSFKSNGNKGLYVISPYASGEILRHFLVERCAKVGKSASDYWTLEELWGESIYRLNGIKNFWLPNGVPYKSIEIDSERKNWEQVTKLIMALLQTSDWSSVC